MVTLGPWDSMVLATTFSTTPNSVMGSLDSSREKKRSRSNTLLIKQHFADGFDLAGQTAIQESLAGFDNEVATLQRGVVFNRNRRIDVSNGSTNMWEVLPADPECNVLVSRNAFQYYGRESGYKVLIEREFSLYDFPCNLERQLNRLHFHRLNQLLVRLSESRDAVFVSLNHGFHHFFAH